MVFVMFITIFFLSGLYWLIVEYNSITKDYNSVELALNDVKIKRELLNNIKRELTLINSNYTRFGNDLISSVTQNRGRNNNLLGMVLNESYPELNDHTHINLQNQIISLGREYLNSQTLYNQAVKTYNSHINSFPSLIAAKIFCFSKIGYEIENYDDRQIMVRLVN